MITDIPASRSNTFDTGISLSDVDKQRKRNAREVVITRAFDSLEQRLLYDKWRQDRNFPVAVHQHFGVTGGRIHMSLPAPYEKHQGCGGTLADMSSAAQQGKAPRPKVGTANVKITIGGKEQELSFDQMQISTPAR